MIQSEFLYTKNPPKSPRSISEYLGNTASRGRVFGAVDSGTNRKRSSAPRDGLGGQSEVPVADEVREGLTFPFLVPIVDRVDDRPCGHAGEVGEVLEGAGLAAPELLGLVLLARDAADDDPDDPVVAERLGTANRDHLGADLVRALGPLDVHPDERFEALVARTVREDRASHVELVVVERVVAVLTCLADQLLEPILEYFDESPFHGSLSFFRLASV